MDIVNDDKWIRIFDITDTSKHHKGFIIFKVTSMLYPHQCPEAVTKLTVWKRYNDFKKLYREMKAMHSKYCIADKLPELSRGTFFKKYDNKALVEKKQSALDLLEYIGNHYQLFTSKQFVKFFETSYAPSDQSNGNISTIKSNLNLPDDPEFLRNTDDDMSENESISTSSSVILHTDLSDTATALPTSGHSSRKSTMKMSGNGTIDTSDNIDSCSIESMTLLDGQIYSSTYKSLPSDVLYVQYIIDASVHVKLAEELENSKKYEESFVAYKTAIDILLRYGKNEGDYDRKRLVKYKSEKYLLRAEKLYNMYLAPEVKNLRSIFQPTKEKDVTTKPSISNLYKYSVVRIIGSGMLVVHSDSQQLFYVKVIHKTTKFLDDNLVLPENIPYMINLYNYFNCDNALFLILEYVNGRNLRDYLKHMKDKYEPNNTVEITFDTVQCQISDDESEKSFSELINNYTKSKTDSADSDGSFEKITIEDVSVDLKNIIDQPIPQNFVQNVADFTNFEQAKYQSPSRQSSVLSNLNVETELNDKPDQKLVVKWTAQLILALEKLHILGITCKNLSSRNLIIDQQLNLNLTFMCNIKDLCDIFNNTRNSNLAPEVHGIGPVGKEADWWCLGAILYEVLVGMDLNDVHPQYFSASTILKVPKYVSPEARSLLKQLLVYEPKNRIGAGPHGIDKLKSHPFFKGVDWIALIEKSVR